MEYIQQIKRDIEKQDTEEIQALDHKDTGQN